MASSQSNPPRCPRHPGASPRRSGTPNPEHDMSRKDSESAAVSAKAPTTVEEAIGPLTQNAVDGADDAVTNKLLLDARNIVLGLATLLLNSDDPQDQAVVQLLAEVNVGMRDLQMLTALAAAVLAAAEARDAAETAAREATAKL